ncbi:MAG: hypothetical protein MUC49_12405 [Raineya sp.]|jgi:Leucine-rich repeat (LRR) protein|nr:hypothetical protein [Raineya sp.]
MNEDIIKKGFWNTEEYNDFNIKITTFLEDYEPTEKLRLLITQLEHNSIKRKLTATQSKKLIDSWCVKLPELKEVKYLWLPSRVSQKIFDSICEMENLEGLWIKWSGIESINNINKLKNLKHLHIGSSSKIEDISILGEMKSLITLKTEQLSKITDFSVIGKLTQLEGLGIDGSITTAQKIDNIEFMSSLQQLKYLTLAHTQMKQKSFDSLLKLQNLEKFLCDDNYPKKEFEKLKTIKTLRFGNIETL